MDESRKKTKAFFDSLADKWDSISYHDKDRIETIITLTGLKAGDKVLDIGAGTGILTPTILEHDPKEVLAIDLSTQMTKIAKEKFRETDKVTFREEDFYDLGDSGFDYAICYSAYPHFEDKEGFAEKLHQCLAPGGRFVVAHSESKETINARHKGDRVEEVSDALVEAPIEADYFREFFDVDVLVDTDNFYIISGRRKD